MKEGRRTTQLQAEEGILRNGWLCEGKDVTSDSEVQHPDPSWPLVKRGTHMTAP